MLWGSMKSCVSSAQTSGAMVLASSKRRNWPFKILDRESGMNKSRHPTKKQMQNTRSCAPFSKKPRLKGPRVWAGKAVDHQPVHASQDRWIWFHILQGVTLTRLVLDLEPRHKLPQASLSAKECHSQDVSSEDQLSSPILAPKTLSTAKL